MADFRARVVAAQRHLVRQPQLFLALGDLGNAVAKPVAQKFFVGFAQRFFHRQVRAPAGHMVVAQHQPVVFVVDPRP